MGLFAKTNLISHQDGVLVITTNKTLLLVISNRTTAVIHFKTRP